MFVSCSLFETECMLTMSNNWQGNLSSSSVNSPLSDPDRLGLPLHNISLLRSTLRMPHEEAGI